MGRRRSQPKGPRTIDLDILLFGDSVIQRAGAGGAARPAMHERRFVLDPLAEIAPGARHPIFNKTVRELLRVMQGDQGQVERKLPPQTTFPPSRPLQNPNVFPSVSMNSLASVYQTANFGGATMPPSCVAPSAAASKFSTWNEQTEAVGAALHQGTRSTGAFNSPPPTPPLSIRQYSTGKIRHPRKTSTLRSRHKNAAPALRRPLESRNISCPLFMFVPARFQIL